MRFSMTCNVAAALISAAALATVQAADKPSDPQIAHITYTAGDPSSIALSGASATREAINGYRQALSADAQFKSVSIPVADLTAAPGARFSLTLMGAF